MNQQIIHEIRAFRTFMPIAKGQASIDAQTKRIMVKIAAFSEALQETHTLPIHRPGHRPTQKF